MSNFHIEQIKTRTNKPHTWIPVSPDIPKNPLHHLRAGFLPRTDRCHPKHSRRLRYARVPLLLALLLLLLAHLRLGRLLLDLHVLGHLDLLADDVQQFLDDEDVSRAGVRAHLEDRLGHGAERFDEDLQGFRRGLDRVPAAQVAQGQA